MTEKATITRLPLTKLSVNLGALIRRVHINKEHFILEKDGTPVAALLDIDEYEDYIEMRDQGLKQQIREGHREYHRGALSEDLDTFLTRIKALPMERAKK